ncbi:MAG: RNA polymerase sigma factor for flagellar operon FliA [Candidatus Poriferisodalaceae bacterium]|jgi:RNA polymerase sigma factor for flagellar operon FliA
MCMSNPIPEHDRDIPVVKRDTDIDELWIRYRETADPTDRDRLILNYASLVKFVASRVARGLPQSVETNELVSNGMFGLMDAIEKFEPERGFKFETYAMSRIRGSILDSLRATDWVPRSVRTKARQLERAYSRFESRYHRAPSEAELAEDLGLTVVQVQNMMKAVANSGVIALDETVGNDRSETITLGDTVADRDAGPTEVFDDEELRQTLAAEINELPEREKLVLALYYFGAMNLGDIGVVLGVTESRICQIHTKAVLHLKARLAAVDRDLHLGSRATSDRA